MTQECNEQDCLECLTPTDTFFVFRFQAPSFKAGPNFSHTLSTTTAVADAEHTCSLPKGRPHGHATRARYARYLSWSSSQTRRQNIANKRTASKEKLTTAELWRFRNETVCQLTGTALHLILPPPSRFFGGALFSHASTVHL